MRLSMNPISNAYISLLKHLANKVIHRGWVKIGVPLSLIVFLFIRCNTSPQTLNFKSARKADTTQYWVFEQTWPDELDSIPDNIKTRKIKTPDSFKAMFEKSEFIVPDSILITSYFRKHSDTAVTEYTLDKFQFMDIHYSLYGDTTDHFPSNHRTFASFAKYFKDCPYDYVRGYANFSNEEIYFIFGENNWVRQERFIFTCNGYVRISKQGHSASENKIFWNKELIDSSECPVGHF